MASGIPAARVAMAVSAKNPGQLNRASSSGNVSPVRAM